MARAIWQGAINFGLVNVPVELFSATQDHTVHFRQYERGTSDRIRYRRVNERTGKEVSYDDIVNGYEVGDGYIPVEREELEQIAPGRSRTIDIEAFVDIDDIDPIYFQKSYWLGPAKKDNQKPYGLLLEAMRRTNKAGIATFVMRGKEHLAAVRAGERVLVLDTLLFADEIRDPSKQLRELPSVDAGKRELEMATSLIESMSDEWRPEDHRDDYTARVHKLIEDKQAGREVVAEEEPAEPTKVVDLMEALSRSVENNRASRKKKPAQGKKQSKQDTLGEMSKADLDKLARELDIKGRSKLTRNQLEDRIRKAQPQQRAS